MLKPGPDSERDVADVATERAAAAPFLAPAGSDSEADGPGPAAELQAWLQRALDEPERKWSPRRTWAFVLLSCGTFWAAVVWAVARLIRLT